MANLANADCLVVEMYRKKQPASSFAKKGKTLTTMSKVVTKMSVRKVVVAKRGMWQHISHVEYYRDVVGLCAEGTIPRDILRKHIVTKQEIVDIWEPRCTGPSGQAHGGFSIYTPTAIHLRGRVKGLWAQFFLKKQITNQQITEEFAVGILAESKDPQSVDWVFFAADKMKKHWSQKLEKGIARSIDKDDVEKEGSGSASCEGDESEVEGESEKKEEESKQEYGGQESEEEAKHKDSKDEKKRKEVSKEKDERGDREEDIETVLGKREEVLASTQRAPSTGKEVDALVEEPLAIEEAL
jgi:hypothetical protein